MVKKCGENYHLKKAYVITTYNSTSLPKPIKVESACVKNKKRALKCNEGEYKKSSYTIKSYGGVVLDKPLKVKEVCVKKKKVCEEVSVKKHTRGKNNEVRVSRHCRSLPRD